MSAENTQWNEDDIVKMIRIYYIPFRFSLSGWLEFGLMLFVAVNHIKRKTTAYLGYHLSIIIEEKMQAFIYCNDKFSLSLTMSNLQKKSSCKYGVQEYL